MIEDTVDYKAIAEGLQHDLEQARLTIVRMRHARNPLDRLDGDAIRQFVQRNYLVLVVVILGLSFIVSSLKTIRGLFTSKE